jgi:hypothetical protein
MKIEQKPFDFDRWADLAQQDPAVFERLRQLTVELAILKHSRRNRERLQGLQWRIDRVREQARTPMAACVHLSDLMWDTFERLNESYHDPDAVRRTAQPRTPPIPLRDPRRGTS